MTRVIDENKMIVKPCLYARSDKHLEVGDESEFNSSGWTIYGIVQEVIERNTFQGCQIYLVEKYEKLVFNGLERTEDEEIAYQKELERKKQLKLKFGEDEG